MSVSVAPKSASVSPELSNAAPRLHFIDGLRGLAMLMVLVFHCASYSNGWYISHHELSFLSYGHVGVNLFLVLSGFCLYWPFVNGKKRPEPTLWEFAKKRCRRILPPYYAALALFWLFLLWDTVTHHHIHEDATSVGHVVKSLFWHLPMLYNLRPEYVISINGPFWSLALEFSLYILFPVLVEMFRRQGPIKPVLILLAVTLVYRQILSTFYPPQTLTGEEQFVLYYSLFGRCFEFGAGMLAAYILARPDWRPMVTRYAGLGGAAAGFAAVLMTTHFGLFASPVDALWGVCFGLLIVAASKTNHAFHRGLSHPALVRLGVFSYSVYLIHQPLVKLLDKIGLHHHIPAIALGLLVIIPLALGLGYVFHLLFEKPFMTPPRPRKVVVFAPAPVAKV